MGERRRRSRVEPTAELRWEQLQILCAWPEQLAYEEILPLTLLGSPVPGRARETGVGERTLYRRLARFEAEGMESFFGSEKARRRRLPPTMWRLVVDLKAEHLAFNPNEIANACSGYASGGTQTARRFGASWKRNPLPCGSCAAFRSTTRSPRDASAGWRWSRCTPGAGAPRP
jgi:hypothetical protein